MKPNDNKNSSLDQNCLVLLDLTFHSSLLSSKIADIPHKLKYETIVKPIFEYCFNGVSDDSVWDLDWTNFYENNPQPNNLVIDWSRDANFIYSKLFDLPFLKVLLLAVKLGLWKKRSFVLHVSQFPFRNMLMLEGIDQQFLSDREIVMAIVKENARNLEFAIKEFQNDYEIVKTAVELEGISLQFASRELQENREIVTMAVNQDGAALAFASPSLRNDREIVECALESKPSSLIFASNQLKKDRELVFKVFTTHPYDLIQCIDSFKHFQNDKEFKKLLFKFYEEMKKKVSSIDVRRYYESFVMKSLDIFEVEDREIMRPIVKQDGYCFRYISGLLKSEKEFIELAFETYPDVIYSIPEEYRDDFEYMSRLVGKRGFEKIPKEFRNDLEIIKESIKIEAKNYEKISMELKRSREFTLQAVKLNGLVLKYVNEFQKDREIVITAVLQHGCSINSLPMYSEFLDDEEIILKSLEYKNISMINRDEAFKFYPRISARLKNDREFNLELCKRAISILSYLPRKYLIDREFMMECLEIDSKEAFLQASCRLQCMDRAFAIRAVKRNGLILGEMFSKHRNDREIVSVASNQNPLALKFASESLRIEFSKMM